MYYVYILKSEKNGRYYIGSTQNLKDRIKGHNAGKSKSTRPYTPYKLVHREGFEALSDARKREDYIKNRKSRNFVEGLINPR